MKRFNRILAWMMCVCILAAAAVFFSPESFTAHAADSLGTVTVVFENTTLSEDDGAAWYGSYTAEIEIADADTLETILTKAGEKLGLELVISSGDYGLYIEEAGGLKEADGGDMGGFLFTINGWFPDAGIGNYSVSNGIEAGDTIALLYSCAWGADVGNDYSNSGDTTLASLTVSRGSLDETFSSDVTEYTLTLPAGTEKAVFAPKAKYGSYQVRMYSGAYAPGEADYDAYDDTYYPAGSLVPVEDGSAVYVGVAEASWPGSTIWYQDDDGNWDSYAPDATVYKINIEISDEAAAVEDLDDIYKETGKALLAITEPVYGNDWLVFTLARAGLIDEAAAKKYYDSVCALVKEKGAKLKDNASTENSKVILTLGALGYDPTDVEGVDLLEPLSDMDYANQGGVYGPLYALLAIQSRNYDIVSYGGTATTDDLLRAVISYAMEDGGYAWEGAEAGDVDTTAMVLPAFAPSVKSKERARVAAEDAFAFLSGVQNEDAGFSSFFSGINTESTAVVSIALSAFGRDAASDEEFTKNGYNVLEAVCAFYLGDGKFEHIAGGGEDSYATYQAYQALVAYYRNAEGKTSLYDLSDVELIEKEEPVATPDDADDVQPDDSKKTSPATGDSMLPMMMAAAALLSLAGAVAVRRSQKG